MKSAPAHECGGSGTGIVPYRILHKCLGLKYLAVKRFDVRQVIMLCSRLFECSDLSQEYSTKRNNVEGVNGCDKGGILEVENRVYSPDGRSK